MGYYLEQKDLENLKYYKYSVLDASPFSKYVLQPYWNYCIRFVPIRIAPNLITLIGSASSFCFVESHFFFLLGGETIEWFYQSQLCRLFGLFLSWVLCFYYVPAFEGPAPLWLYVLAGLCVEWYSLLDNLDGRQARRTGSSSPLGELFDHGCDCLSVPLHAAVAACILQFGPGYMSMLTLLSSSATFWFSTWEQYHTGTLYLGVINGPTEGLKLMMLAYFWTAFVGPSFWTSSYKDVLSLRHSALVATWPDTEMRDLTSWALFLPLAVTLIFNIKSVVEHRRAQKQAVLPAMLQLLPFVVYVVLVTTWWYVSWPLWEKYPHILQVGVSMGFAEMTNRLILGHLCKMPFHVLQRPLLPLVIVTAHALYAAFSPSGGLVTEEAAMWVFVAVSVLCCTHYSLSVIADMCKYLGINCLSIPPLKSKDK
ncbi:Choline phosphotransferase 1 [Balamuthia mandrillaris]